MKTHNIYNLVYLFLAFFLLSCSQIMRASKEVDISILKDDNDSMSNSSDDILDNQALNNNTEKKVVIKKSPPPKVIRQKLEDILKELDQGNSKSKLTHIPELVKKYHLLQKIFQTRVGGKNFKRSNRCRLIRLFTEKCSSEVLKKQINHTTYGTLFKRAKNQKWRHGCLLLMYYKLMLYEDFLMLGEYYVWSNSKKKVSTRLFDTKFKLKNDMKNLDVEAILSSFVVLKELVKKVKTKEDYVKMTSAISSMMKYAITYDFLKSKKFKQAKDSVNIIYNQLKKFQSNNDDLENKNNDNSSEDDSDNSDSSHHGDDVGKSSKTTMNNISTNDELSFIQESVNKISNIKMNDD